MLESADRDVKQFCDMNSGTVSQIVAFLANAKLGKDSFRAPYTSMELSIGWGGKPVKARILVADPHPKYKTYDLGDWEDKLLDSLFKAFRLGESWRYFKNNGPARYSAHRLMREELRRRGGGHGLSLLSDIVQSTMESGKPQAKRDAHRMKGELNRALAHLRKARKLGATPRQIGKLARTILAEEAVAEVQNA